jgi:hypothetical protein
MRPNDKVVWEGLQVRHLAVALTILVIFSSAVPRVSSQLGEWSTSITDLRYSAEPVYNVDTPWVEATVAYQNAPTGWYLAVSVIDLEVLESRRGTYWFGDINQITGKETWQTWVDDSRSGLVKGTPSGTPVECGTSFGLPAGVMLTVIPGYAWCAIPIGGTAQPTYLSGSENIRFQLENLAPRIWRMRILSTLYLIRGAGFGPARETVSFRDFPIAVVTEAHTTSSLSTVTNPTTATASIATTVAAATQSEIPTTSALTTPSTVQPSWESSWAVLILASIVLLVAVVLSLKSRLKKSSVKIFCVECGAKNSTKNKFCEKCGRKLKQ